MTEVITFNLDDLNQDEVALPDTIKILHKVFALRERAYKESFGNARLAEINFMDGEINYLKLQNSEVVDSILHEVLHGVIHMFALDIGPEEEEQLVSAVATGITTVMKDNPDLMPALQDMLDNE